ncbi:MAG: carboxypeptidase-like regulatory domain-containing protein, partial [Schleiferiaceae bacterium]|nr:carboxypeptidase-like regulatory domain-containing protein [Schleiferiaceae bacterium]
MLMAMQVMGQASTIRGYVLERGSQVPLEYAEVQLQGHALKTFTNGDGFFQINDAPVGQQTLEVIRVGYAKQTRKVDVKYARASFERFLMEESTIELVGVVVNAKRQEQQTKVATASIQLSPKTIGTFSIGGEPDLVRALQVLPGVITTGDQGGQLYIRGGAPIQNLIKLDGMILYNP